MTRPSNDQPGSGRPARRASAALALGLLGGLAFAPSTLASHLGAAVDCGSAGTFTLDATETGNGDWQAPGPGDVILLEEGGTLTVFELWVDGNLRFSKAAVGRTRNALAETQCSFTIGTGQLFEVEGLLILR